MFTVPKVAVLLISYTLIVVITVTAILAASASKFIATPLQSFIDLEGRANLTDRADSALRSIARNIRNALPNSLRVNNGTNHFVEFLPIKAAGRYRQSKGASSADDPLDFTTASDTFDVLGNAITIDSGDQLVIYNLGESGASAYESSANNRRSLTTIGTLNNIGFSGSPFPLSSPGSRFYTVTTPVTYVCDMTTDTSNKKLVMYSNYPIQATQPTTIASLSGLSNVRISTLAENLTTCQFDYSSGISERRGIINITIAMTQNGANVRLMHQVNIVNTP